MGSMDSSRVYIVGAGPGAVVLQAITALLAVLSTVTVIQRFVYVYRVTRADG